MELDLDRVAEASCASLSTRQIQRCVMISEYNLIVISLEKHLRKIRSAGSDDEVRKLEVEHLPSDYPTEDNEDGGAPARPF